METIFMIIGYAYCVVKLGDFIEWLVKKIMKLINRRRS